jgi:two-component system chemotaxis response regulator CheY
MAKTALIVDDSRTMRRMIALSLGRAGFDIIEGGNGEEALAKLAALPGGKVDLIITDLNMPVMDGFAFIRKVRLQASTRFTPILLLTTEGNESRKAEGKLAGATGWIVKPFNPDQLLRVIDMVVTS